MALSFGNGEFYQPSNSCQNSIKVILTDLYGNRISFGRATGRFLIKIFISAILGIGFLLAFFTKKKQTLHDLIAGTLVLNKR